ncbi:glyoxalase [Gordonia amarae]|uniref:VOC domain-containing protein n=2 Tax=Gordonia amarae TaxID=36821 RepID=G7GWV9_9ACTN|nr:VOC family protein [Gordonia amarae]MCS3880370.1 putative enzyme related to lactoylglutathione lyase [Gordonia amarae]QHN18714.1 glyoxalase [Gordonia amarae]QHN23189.1 glyoxalase [Gordonia amarae]QHN32091.1 glyoxalase [Gordonia amarae]QHN40837.1 glyoxalase [Gordonia amarae]
MQFTASAISLNVPDVQASAEWARTHLGFEEAMSADGFCSLTHPDAGFNLIYLRTGLPTFTPSSASGTADGLLVVFTVDDIDTDYARLCDEGVDIVTPIETEPWGERYFQMADPNGIIYQLVQWVEPLDPTH